MQKKLQQRQDLCSVLLGDIQNFCFPNSLSWSLQLGLILKSIYLKLEILGMKILMKLP